MGRCHHVHQYINRRKSCNTIWKLSNDPTASNLQCIASANQIAYQLLVNRSGTLSSEPKVLYYPQHQKDYDSLVYLFSEEEYRKGVTVLKNNNADGRDVLVEQLNNLSPKAHRCLLAMLNKCFAENKVQQYGLSKIIRILNAGKDTAIPKRYRPISLLCYTNKLYERMILNGIAPTIGHHLIKEQTGFRPSNSCTIQLLNLTQHIEVGHQESMITGTAFVDLSAAYITVPHTLLIQKRFNTM